MRAVDPYSIVSDPDPDADKELDPTLQKNCGMVFKLCKKIHYEEG